MVPLGTDDKARADKLERLLEVNCSLAVELDLDRLLVRTAEETTRLVEADRCSLYVLDREREELWTRVAQGVEEIRLPLGKGIAGKVAQSGRKVNSSDAYAMTEFDASWDRKHEYRTRSMLCIPLTGRSGSVIGVFAVLNSRNGAFSRDDEMLLEAIGAGVAISLEHTLLVDDLRKTNNKLSQAYDQLMQSEKLTVLGLLASTLAHDIQNPLAVILGNAELLQKRFPDEKAIMDAAETIMRQSDRASKLVDSVRNYARRSPSGYESVHLHRVISESLVLTERLLVQNGVSVDHDYSADSGTVWGNAGQLEQVFMNLIQNAAQVMTGGGTITLKTCRVEEDQVQIEVSDTGGGVPEELQDQIFEAFFTTRGKGKGTGLGLAICKRIVDDHGGRIDLQNRPGKGATFRIRLSAQALAG